MKCAVESARFEVLSVNPSRMPNSENIGFLRF